MIASLEDIDAALRSATDPEMRRRLLAALAQRLAGEKVTTPFLRTRALVLTKELLQRLASLGDDAVPLSLAAEAEALLKHFPTLMDIEAVHRERPDIFGPVPPFQRDIPNSQILGILDAASQAGEQK
jgi:hypothetical protein